MEKFVNPHGYTGTEIALWCLAVLVVCVGGHLFGKYILAPWIGRRK